jgi:hypothetical protein
VRIGGTFSAGPADYHCKPLAVAGKARRLIVRLDRAWPWATDLVAAFTRLRALPARC